MLEDVVGDRNLILILGRDVDSHTQKVVDVAQKDRMIRKVQVNQNPRKLKERSTYRNFSHRLLMVGGGIDGSC